MRGPIEPGDGERVFHVDPAGAGNVDATFRSLQILGGDAWCSGAGCSAGGGAIEALNGRDLTVEDCMVANNSAARELEGCGRGAAAAGGIVHRALSDLSVLGSTFTENTASCNGTDCDAGSAAIAKADLPADATVVATIRASKFRANEASCEAVECRTRGIVSVEAETIEAVSLDFRSNSTFCSGSECRGGDLLEVDGSTVDVDDTLLDANEQACQDGRCDTGRGLDANALMFQSDGLRFKANRASCDGSSCEVREIFDLSAESGSVENMSVLRNRGSCSGPQCTVLERLYWSTPGGSPNLHGVSVAGNRSQCRAQECTALAPACGLFVVGGDGGMRRFRCGVDGVWRRPARLCWRNLESRDDHFGGRNVPCRKPAGRLCERRRDWLSLGGCSSGLANSEPRDRFFPWTRRRSSLP